MELPVSNATRLGGQPLFETVVHGTNDDVVPIEMSRRYVEHRRKLGGNVEYVEFPGADHYDLIDPISMQKLVDGLPDAGWIDVEKGER